MILSADFLRRLNHGHKSWPTLSIVWHICSGVQQWRRILFQQLSSKVLTDGLIMVLNLDSRVGRFKSYLLTW